MLTEVGVRYRSDRKLKMEVPDDALMACDEYEQLKQAWGYAMREEDLAYNPDSRQLPSNKRLIGNRNKTTAERERCERAIEAHLETCKQCIAEGIKPLKAPRPG